MENFMKQMANRFSISTIALIIGLSAVSGCRVSEKTVTDKGSAGGMNQGGFAANDKANAESKTTNEAVVKTPKDGMPSLKSGDDYKKIVREKMLKAGWKPARSENAAVCGSVESICDEFPEYEMCRENGDCEFRWQKNDKTVLISTVGEPFKYGSYAFIKEDKPQYSSDGLIGKYVCKQKGEFFIEVFTYELKPNNKAFFIQSDEARSGKKSESYIADEGTWSWNAAEKTVTATFTYEAGNKSVRQLKLANGNLVEITKDSPRTYERQQIKGVRVE